jgi:hypothetical protein
MDALERASARVDGALRDSGMRRWREFYMDDLLDSLNAGVEWNTAADEVIRLVRRSTGTRSASQRADMSVETVDAEGNVLRVRDFSGFALVKPPPAWWSEHSHSYLRKHYGPIQTWVFGAFGTTVAIAPREASEFITSICRTDMDSAGHEILLPLPIWDGEGFQAGAEVPVHKGRHSSRSHPLYALASHAMDLERQTGARVVQAVGFLLCDVLFDLPWVRVDRIPERGQSRTGTVRYSITVGSPFVSADDVRRCYSATQRLLDPEGSSITKRPRRKRPQVTGDE